MKKVAFFAAVLASGVMFAADAPVFYASFDEDYHGKGAGEKAVNGAHAQKELPALIEGFSGKAALIGASDDKTQAFNILYPAAGILNANCGTISFWCKIINWDVWDKDYHVFFRARGGDAELILYKVPDPMFSFLIGPLRSVDGKKVWVEMRGNVSRWKRDEWHFVTAVWDNGKGALYLDGKLARAREIPCMPGDFVRFGAGGLYPAKWRGKPGNSAIDELKIYDRALTAEEIAAAYTSAVAGK